MGFANVDGSFLVNSGRGGIGGGVFRDSENQVLSQFGKEVLLDLTVHAEVVALREGILVAATSRWVSSYYFVFEFDSNSIVAWVVDPVSAPWYFHNLLRECYYVFGLGIS